MPKHYTLFVFEGIKPEKGIFNALTRYFIPNRENHLLSVYEAEVYQLYRELCDDDDLDLFALLREKADRSDPVSTIKREQVAEIYLFFDYDGHATKASDDTIQKMLELFCNETEHGELYLSYPMSESLWHITDDGAFNSLTVPIGSGTEYKNLVHRQGSEEFSQRTRIRKEQWLALIDLHCHKAHKMLHPRGNAPLEQRFIPSAIFSCQKKNYIDPKHEVAVLSAFPLFLYNYVETIRNEISVSQQR